MTDIRYRWVGDPRTFATLYVGLNPIGRIHHTPREQGDTEPYELVCYLTRFLRVMRMSSPLTGTTALEAIASAWIDALYQQPKDT
jgi:hypothetical protein